MSNDLLELGTPWFLQGEHGGLLPLNRCSNAYESVRQVKTGPGKIYGFTVYNSGAAQFILMLDSARAPASGDVPVFAPVAVAATSTVFVGFADVGRCFNAGCWLANSSTGPTYTAGAADCWFDAQYV